MLSQNVDIFKIFIDLSLSEHAENLNIATSCRYDSSLGMDNV